MEGIKLTIDDSEVRRILISNLFIWSLKTIKWQSRPSSKLTSKTLFPWDDCCN